MFDHLVSCGSVAAVLNERRDVLRMRVHVLNSDTRALTRMGCSDLSCFRLLENYLFWTWGCARMGLRPTGIGRGILSRVNAFYDEC